MTFVAASADTEFSFDYLFFGQSDGGMMTFCMSDGEALTLEAADGSSVTPPETPQFPGKRFLGWFDRPEGEAGTKETGFTVSAGQEKTLYAVYETVPAQEPRSFRYLDEEAEIIEKAAVPVWVWIAAGAAVLCIGIVVAVLLLRKKKPVSAE